MSWRIAAYPWYSENAYQRLFYEALSSSGVTVSRDTQANTQWLEAHASQLDAIHLHWPEARWASQRGVRRVRAIGGMLRFLRRAKSLGLRRLWTVHNMDVHESAGLVDRWALRMIARQTDLLIAHSQWSADEIRRRWNPRAPIVVMPHGNYDGVYPAPRSRDTVLRSLGLNPELPMVSAIGHMRNYKGLDLVADAARRLAPRVQVLIAGQPHPDFEIESLRRLAAETPTVRVLERVVLEQEYADLMSASDAQLLPYTKITGSGALLAAWTLGTGVIAADLAYFRELGRDEPHAMRRLARLDDESLAGAIGEYLEVPRELRRQAARRMADRFAWSKCVQPVIAALDGGSELSRSTTNPR